MMNINQHANNDIDSRIRTALINAENKGKLSVVSAVTGVHIEVLKKILTSKEPLSLMDRAMLGVHLE